MHCKSLLHLTTCTRLQPPTKVFRYSAKAQCGTAHAGYRQKGVDKRHQLSLATSGASNKGVLWCFTPAYIREKTISHRVGAAKASAEKAKDMSSKAVDVEQVKQDW